MTRLLRIFLLTTSVLLLTGCQFSLPYQKKAGLQVITEGSTASLFLDDQYLDTTPYINKKIQPGAYRLKIQPSEAGKVAFETPLKLNQGILTVVTWKPGSRPETSGGVIYEMEMLKGGKTQLSVVAIPDGALVKIDEREQMIAPVLLEDLSPGQHTLSVSQPSYEGQTHTINLVEGHKLTASFKLAKLDVAESANATPTPQPSPASPSSSSAIPKSTSSSSTPSAAATRSGATQRTASQAATQTTKTVPLPRVLIKPTGYVVGGVEGLRVRSTPSASGTELGLAKVGEYFPYAGGSQSGWYSITFEGKTGWVSGQYATLEQ